MMAAEAVGEDFYLRGRQSQLLAGSSPRSSHVTSARRSRLRDPTSEVRFQPDADSLSWRETQLQPQLQGEQPGAQLLEQKHRTPVPPEEHRWYLEAPRHLATGDYPVNRLDGLPERPVATPDERREGLMGGLLAASDISRAAALAGRDRPPPPAAESPQRPPRPVDFDPLAAVHFPVTLGSSYRVREQIEASGGAASAAADPRLTFSPPGSGLPYPLDPWRLRTPHNAEDFEPRFRSVGEHLAGALPAARQQRERLMAEAAPSTAAAEVFVSSPYSVELAQLRMQRLRIEEEILLEVKRQQELERTAPPKEKWFELRTPQFHYEAHKNSELVRGSTAEPQLDAQLFEYRQQLMSSSERFRETFDAYARLRSRPV